MDSDAGAGNIANKADSMADNEGDMGDNEGDNMTDSMADNNADNGGNNGGNDGGDNGGYNGGDNAGGYGGGYRCEEEEDEGDDDFLYGDLEDSGRSADYVKLTEKVAELTKKNKAITAEMLEMRQQLVLLVEEKAVVENNMIVMYNTAQREMDRKDKQLSQLMTDQRLGASTINNSVGRQHR